MTAFVLAAIIAASICLLLFLGWGRRRLNVSAGESIVAGAGVVLLFVLFFEYTRFYIVGSLDRRFYDGFISLFDGSYLQQAFFGALFGTFFSYWLYSVLMRQEVGVAESEKANGAASKKAEGEGGQKAGAGFRDLTLWIMMLVLLLVGLGERQTIKEFVSLVQGVKLPGGMELTLGRNANRPGDTSLAVLVPPPKGSGSSYAAPDVSGGLTVLGDLAGAIRRDALYFALQKKGLVIEVQPKKTREGAETESKAASPHGEVHEILKDLRGAIQVTQWSLGKLGKCLHKHVDFYGDDRPVATALLPVARALRTLLFVDNGKVITNADLVEPVVTEFDKIIPDLRWQVRAEVEECKDTAQDDSHLSRKEKEQLLKAYLKSAGAYDRPYLWSAAAAALAYNHEYTASISLLHQWLIKQESDKNNRKLNIDLDLMKIFEIRIRSQIAAYIEEWVSYQPLAKTQTVLDYHRENLRIAIELLEKITAGIHPSLLSQIGLDHEKEADSDPVCERFTQQREWVDAVKQYIDPYDVKSSGHEHEKENLTVGRMELSLIQTLLSLKRTWIDAAMLGDDDYWKQYANVAQRYADDFQSMNLACLRLVKENDSDYAPLWRAKTLDSIARVQHARALRIAHPKEREEQLRKALDASRRGLKLAAPIVVHDRHLAAPFAGFAARISGTEAIQTNERLNEISDQIEKELGRS